MSRELVGFFVNTIVLRTNFSKRLDATYVDWFQEVKATVADGLENQFVPFPLVVDACQPTRSLQQNPLFNVMFQVQSDGYRSQNAMTESWGAEGLSWSQSHIELTQTKFDLTWHVLERDDGLLIAVEFRTSLFREPRILRLLADFDSLLSQLVQQPTIRIGDLRLNDKVAACEGVMDLGKRNTHKDITPATPETFPQAFNRIAHTYADAVAVRSRERAMNFRELAQQSTLLAKQLRAGGINAEDIVAICLPRDCDLLVAILGVMKSGAAYLPIDPSLPKGRQEFMITDAGCRLCIDEDFFAQPFEDPMQAEATHFDSNHCAYVIYTSGSTGKPKGTAISHGSLMHYLRWCLDAYPWDDGWGAPVQSSIGFDATITSLLAPLLAGKTVELIPDENVIESLAAAMQSGPSIVKLTPAHLAAVQPLLPTDLKQQQLPSALIIGGEALLESHLAFWRENYPSVQLINEYGPTETVVGCCIHNGHDASHDRQGKVPIGRAIDGTHLYVLDRYGNQQPRGIPGELFIAAPSAARG
ncbi:MAG: AMP-binding protein, partial [Planctomycetota bacterium]